MNLDSRLKVALFKTHLHLIMQIPLSFFDQGCSYMAQYMKLPIVCKLQQRFWNADMAYESKSRLNILNICCIARNMHSHSCFDGVGSYLRQQMLVVCRLQQIFHFTNMTLSKRSRSHILKTCLQLETQTSLLFFD